MTNLTVEGVNEKQIKTIIDTTNGLCNGVKGQYRDMARKVFSIMFGAPTKAPTKNHVLQSLKAAKRCELTLDGVPVARENIKIATHDSIKKGEIIVDEVEWEKTSSTLKVKAKVISAI